MLRIMGSLAIASLLVSFLFGQFFWVAFPLIAVFGAAPAALLLLRFRESQWLKWWHSLIAGFIAGLPGGLLLNQVGCQTLAFYASLGSVMGVFVWLTGVFRNSLFMDPDTPFPKSIALAIPICSLLFLYSRLLASTVVYGCVIDYQVEQHPVSLAHARITLQPSDGAPFEASVSAYYSAEDLLGSCSAISKSPTLTLTSQSYRFRSNRTNDCQLQCASVTE